MTKLLKNDQKLPKLNQIHQFYLLVDGSGSMAGGPNAPLQTALSAAEKLSKDVSIHLALWGDKVVHEVSLDKIDSVRNGLHSGSNFGPAVDYIAEKSQLMAYPRHFIVISDGGITDDKETAAKLISLCKARPDVKLHVVLLNQNEESETKISKAFAERSQCRGIVPIDTLQNILPQQIRVHRLLPGDSLDEELSSITRKIISPLPPRPHKNAPKP